MTASRQRTIAVVTGTRAEFGLLLPVMCAITAHPALRLLPIATGTHCLPDGTLADVQSAFPAAIALPMYDPARTGRAADAAALGRAVSALADLFHRSNPFCVLVLGDRIEALAAALAAAVSGIRVAHIHGGDRAEGLADESIRHAISKLAHLHFPATPASSHRLVAMGEDPARIHVVGSPAIDGLLSIPPLSDSQFASFGSPEILFLLHPTSDDDSAEHDRAARLIHLAAEHASTLLLHPNHDPGRAGILRAISSAPIRSLPHLPRRSFIGLLKRVHLLLGNSSAGLIECAALGLRALNIGSRQNGRESPPSVTSLPWDSPDTAPTIRQLLAGARSAGPLPPIHPYGSGTTGASIARILAEIAPSAVLLTKLNTY